VAREFASNRAEPSKRLFKTLNQYKESLNKVNIKIPDQPMLENNEDFRQLQSNLHKLKESIEAVKKSYERVEKNILSWNWNDPVSTLYAQIFRENIIIEVEKSKDELLKDLHRRIALKIPPGYKDANKGDEGIGDLVIWQTVLEIGKKFSRHIILVTNDKKSDWFYTENNQPLYPRFELYEEYRTYTQGKTINIISFSDFLEISSASFDTITDVTNISSQENLDNYFIDNISTQNNQLDQYTNNHESYELNAHRRDIIDFENSSALSNLHAAAFNKSNQFEQYNKKLQESIASLVDSAAMNPIEKLRDLNTAHLDIPLRALDPLEQYRDAVQKNLASLADSVTMKSIDSFKSLYPSYLYRLKKP
jgi:hypothetical protein